MQRKSKSMVKKKKRITTFAFLLFFIIALMLSEALVLSHAAHDDEYHHEDSCSVCVYLHNNENIKRYLRAAPCGDSFEFAQPSAAKAVLCLTHFTPVSGTPVELQERMNN